jgi:hypothetical protein
MEVCKGRSPVLHYAYFRSACPLQAEIPIEAAGFIPVSPLNVAGIPALALTIPDFKGEAILRIFSNSTQTEIGCFAAQIMNGNTFDHHVEVGSALAAFTVLALLSSFGAVAYFDTMPITRSHYAHSCSVLVIFAVWHHIFYSGALAVNWPTVLVAFWNNYAWTSGLVKLEWMQRAISNFVGSPKSSLATITSMESNYDMHNIYKRLASRKATSIEGLVQQGIVSLAARASDNIIEREVTGDSEAAFNFRGRFINSGLPLPGDHFGFAALLAKQNMLAANAFSTALIFLLITFAITLLAVASLSLLLSAMVRLRLLQDHSLSYFRAHLGGYLLLIVSRAFFVSFFAVTFLAISQFSFLASTGAAALACILLIAYLLVPGGAACYALVCRYKHSFRMSQPDRINIEYVKFSSYFHGIACRNQASPHAPKIKGTFLRFGGGRSPPFPRTSPATMMKSSRKVLVGWLPGFAEPDGGSLPCGCFTSSFGPAFWPERQVNQRFKSLVYLVWKRSRLQGLWCCDLSKVRDSTSSLFTVWASAKLLLQPSQQPSLRLSNSHGFQLPSPASSLSSFTAS